MSILQTPRILLKGEISWDPVTTNNYDQFYNEATDQTVFPTAQDRVAAFRQQAIGAVATQGSWNPHGTYRSTFYDAAISGVDIGTGVTTSDPFVQSNASFTGMLVDLEPYGAISSQLFFDQLQLGVDGGYSILCKRSSRITARYINFHRNPANAMIAGVASVVWQTSFRKELLHIHAFDSPALQALAQALEAEDVLGLTVRMNAYRTIYYDNLALTNGSPLAQQAAQDLINKLNVGGFQPNPARSLFVGAVGLWRRDEPIHEPGDRALLANKVSRPKQPFVGTAFARLDGTTLTLDLANSIPETDKDCTKANLGTLSVVALSSSGGGSTPLGTIPYCGYDKAAYEASSGIVTLQLTEDHAKLAATSDIQVVDGNGHVQLTEAALRAIPVVPNNYMNEGETANVAFQVYERGFPAQGEHAVTLYQMSADGSTVTNTSSLQTDGSGLLSFSVSGTQGDVVAFVAAPDESQGPGKTGINTQINTYLYVRTLAADANIAALPPTWDNVFTNVLANWNAMAPCMDNWLMLNDPMQVKAYAAVIKRLTDPAHFESFRYMPVTRDLTPGGRTLLYNFLDAPAEALDAAVAVNYAKLSRSLRRP